MSWTWNSCVATVAILATVGAAPAQPLREISIGVASSSMSAVAPRIAKELGLFEKHGFAARLIIMESSSSTVTALISGSLKLVNAGVIELIVAQARGQKVVAIANTYSGFAPSLVLSKAVVDKLGVKPTAPLNERLKVLDGLVIASSSATAVSNVVLRSATLAANAAVRFTYMNQTAMPAALETGAIQGFTSGSPYWAIAVNNGSAVLWLNGPAGEFSHDYTPGITAQIQAMRDFAEANPAMMNDIRAVFADLAKAIEERPAEVRAAVARLYPDLQPQVLDLLFASEALGWKGGPLTVKDMAHEIAVVKSAGLMPPQGELIDVSTLVLQ